MSNYLRRSFSSTPHTKGRMEGMSKSVLVVGTMASAMLVASMAALLTATPGVGKPQTVTLVGAGDIAGCDFKADRKTARLLSKIGGTIFTLGDNVYPEGTRSQFRNCYYPTWGKYKKRTRPSVGNHEYDTSSGAKPYFDYFGWRAGKPSRGYYSYDRGTWNIVALNSNCIEVDGCDWRSAQGHWLADPRGVIVHRQGAAASSSWGLEVRLAALKRAPTSLGCRPRRPPPLV